MKIKRIINGVTYEFELTESEMYDVYLEKEREWYATVRWPSEDITDDDEDSLTYDEAAKWWEEHQRGFREALIEMGNEMLCTIDWDEEKRKLRKT